MAPTKETRRIKRNIDTMENSSIENKQPRQIDMMLQDVISGVSLSKKRSLLLPEDRENDEFLEDQEIDDELEKERSREQKKRERLKEKTASEQSNEQTSSLLANLTSAELENHYTQCIQLCNRNKVNVKNAFKLQLIDYMKMIFINQSKKTENLALMGFTLDASAKIYSYRVDNVYTDMLKVMTGKIFKETDGAESGSESQGEEEDKDEIVKTKKGKKKKFDDEDELDYSKMTSSDAELKKTQNDSEGLLKARTMLPSHLEVFLECPLSDPYSLHVLNKPLFDIEEEEVNSTYVSIGGKWETDNVRMIDFSESLPSYCDITKHYFVVGEMNEVLVQTKSLIYDSSLNDVNFAERMKAFEDDDEPYTEDVEPAVDYDDGFSDDEPGMAQPSQNPSFSSSAISKGNYSIKSLSSLVTINDSEFSFFDSGKLNILAGPTHWHVKRRKLTNPPNPAIGTARKETNKKHDSVDLLTGLLPEKLSILEEQEKPMVLSKKTVKTWTRDKNRTVPNIFKLKMFFSMITNKNLFMDKCCTGSLTLETGIAEKSGVEQVHESVSCPTDLALDDSDHYDDGECFSPVQRGNDCESRIEGEAAASGLQLLPAPPKVNKIAVNYAKAQKKVDIMLLKSTLWTLMDLENSEQTTGDSSSPNNAGEKVVTFDKIYHGIPKHLPLEESSQLSPGIVFMALLHMANEKTLVLGDNDDHKNFSIKLG